MSVPATTAVSSNPASVDKLPGAPEAPKSAAKETADKAKAIAPAKMSAEEAAQLRLVERNAALAGNIRGLFNIINGDLALNDKDLKIVPKGNDLEFTIDLNRDFQGKIGNLKLDNSGMKKGFEAAEGAKITVKSKVTGKVNTLTGEITFEGNPITIVKNGITVDLTKINMNQDGSIGKLTVENPMFGPKTLVSTSIVNSENLKSTLSLIQWTDAGNAMPTTMGELSSKAFLEAEDKASKAAKAQGVLNYEVSKKTDDDTTEEGLIKLLSDENLLNKADYKLIGRQKHGYSLQLEDNARSKASLERKMVRGAQELKELDFSGVSKENMKTVIQNLKAMRENMFHSASTQEGKALIWKSMTETINNLANTKDKIGYCEWAASGVRKSYATITNSLTPRFAQKPLRWAKKHKGLIATVAVPAVLLATRLIGII